MKKFNTVNRFDFHLSGFVWQAYLILLTRVNVSAFGKLIQLYDYINNETQNQNAYIFSLETTVNPRLSTPRAAYLFQTHLGRGLFNLAKTMVLALHKGLEYRVKAQVQKVMQPRIKNIPNFQLANRLSRISSQEFVPL